MVPHLGDPLNTREEGIKLNIQTVKTGIALSSEIDTKKEHTKGFVTPDSTIEKIKIRAI